MGIIQNYKNASSAVECPMKCKKNIGVIDKDEYKHRILYFLNWLRANVMEML